MTAPIADDSGSLGATHFSNLLVRAIDERLTGTLLLEEDGGARHGVYFESGAPAKARLTAQGFHLGEILVGQGSLSPAHHAGTLEEAMKSRVLHGQLLLSKGLVSERVLGMGLSEQLLRQIQSLFGQPATTKYGYFNRQNLLARWGGPRVVPVNGLEALWRGVRDEVRPFEIEAALARVSGLKLALRSGLPEKYFDLLGEDRSVVDMLRGRPCRVHELIAAAPSLEASIKRVLYFLVLTRSVDAGVPSAPPLGMDTASPHELTVPKPGKVPTFADEAAAPGHSGGAPSWGSIPAITAASASLREEARQRLARIGTTHYAVLGIPTDAPAAQVQAAFLRLAKRWHPDRLAAKAPDLRDRATRIFASVADAYQTLFDPDSRRRYDEELASAGPGSGQQDAIRTLSAEIAFQRAEALLQRGNIEAARREAKLALEQDPARPDSIALNAWLSAIGPERDVRRIASDLERALRASPDSLRVHWYRGLVLKLFGRHASALQEFRFVTELDPRHIDAAREVRLYEMRLRDSPKDRPSLAPEAQEERKPLLGWMLFKGRS